ncbi:MAG: hypothetical protein J6Q92_08960 [Oscillospiraceae bacterium]|nr:hypothetical protein [Oscillospiraceae bacterium]
MILFYKNSFLASVVSIFGCICIMVILMDIDNYHMDVIVPVIAMGIACLVGGKMISVNKSFKTWWKQLEKAGIVEQIKTDTSIAVAVYNKNPKKATLNKIEKLNPAAAETIRNSVAKK